VGWAVARLATKRATCAEEVTWRRQLRGSGSGKGDGEGVVAAKAARGEGGVAAARAKAVAGWARAAAARARVCATPLREARAVEATLGGGGELRLLLLLL
jgi:hypothetical protein